MAKYIIFDDGLLEYPVIFPEYIQHVDMKNKMYPHKAVSAGFVSLGYDCQACKNVATTYNKSISLKLEPRPQDDGILNKMILGQS